MSLRRNRCCCFSRAVIVVSEVYVDRDFAGRKVRKEANDDNIDCILKIIFRCNFRYICFHIPIYKNSDLGRFGVARTRASERKH